MSDVFISYSRSTADRARVVAEALRAAGFSTWQDEELPPHRPYTQVTQEQLEQSKAVLVLWSADAARSEWVCSEADRGRQAKKLVQVTLDGVLPPMPFDQIQCADLAGWSGDADAPAFRRVLASLGELAGRPAPSQPASFQPAPARSPRRAPYLAGLAAILALAIAGAGVWLWRERGETPAAAAGRIKVAVLPFETASGDPALKDLAERLQGSVVEVLSGQHMEPVSPSLNDTLRGSQGAKAIEQLGARLVLAGAARSGPDGYLVRVRLDDPKAKVTLWSKAFTDTPANRDGLEQRVAHRVMVVLGCSREALDPKSGLTDPALVGRYLNACDLFADWDVHQGYDQAGQAKFGETQRMLTVEAPRFALPFYTSAIGSALAAKGARGDAAAARRADAQARLSRAMALDPGSPLIDAVQSRLVATSAWKAREDLLRHAVSLAPAAGLPNTWLGETLADVGRLRDAAEFGRRASAGDLVWDWGIFNTHIACAVTPTQALADEIAGFRRLLPESKYAVDAQIDCLRALGQPQAALTLLRGLGAARAPSLNQSAAMEAVLTAEVSHRPADAETARQALLQVARLAGDAPVQAQLVANLAALGFVDDAFALADRYDPDTPAAGLSMWFFTKFAEPLRRDRRFMRLAERIGLVDYWRKSGHWPDFCADPALPYDCKTLAAAPPLTPRPRRRRNQS